MSLYHTFLRKKSEFWDTNSQKSSKLKMCSYFFFIQWRNHNLEGKKVNFVFLRPFFFFFLKRGKCYWWKKRFWKVKIFVQDFFEEKKKCQRFWRKSVFTLCFRSTFSKWGVHDRFIPHVKLPNWYQVNRSVADIKYNIHHLCAMTVKFLTVFYWRE